MNGASGKKLTLDTLHVAMSLHERHSFHVAVATDGAKKGGAKDRAETQRLSETTCGMWQGPESAEIIRRKRREATALQERLGGVLNQTDKLRAVEQGILSGRLGDSATVAEAELFAIFALLRKVQGQQDLGGYGNEKARVLIMLDCLTGLRIIEKAITSVREKLGTVIFAWIPSHVGIVPNRMADNIAASGQDEAPDHNGAYYM
eukprot:6181337-Pleurochrysis_carterae.AAC.1